MFLFAVGYAVGPQFVRGVARDGVPQALFSAVQCVFSLVAVVVVAKIAGYDLGYAAGLYSGSQTMSAAMGLSTDAINRLGLPADQAKALIDSMPVAYAVSYMFGTMGSAVVIAVLGPKLLGINLEAACKDYEQKQGGVKELGGPGTAWRRWEVRAYRVAPGGRAVGLSVIEAEALVAQAHLSGTRRAGHRAKAVAPRLFVLRIRRNGTIEEATADTVLREGDVVAVAGARDVLVSHARAKARPRSRIAELLAVPVEGVDVLVSNKAIDGKTLVDLVQMPETRGVFLRKITRGATATDIPILPTTTIQRGDLLTIVGRTQDTNTAIKLLGVADRATDVTDMAFVGAFVVIGALFGSLVLNIGGVPLTLSTAGGALIAGIVGGWLRSVRPTLRTHPDADHLVHELGRPQHLHRHRRHLRRPGLRQRPEDAGRRPVPVGRARDDHPAGPRDVRRQVRVPLPRRAHARHHLRVAHDDGLARPGVRSGEEPGAGARLHRDLRRRQHDSHDLGHGPDHAALVTTPL